VAENKRTPAAERSGSDIHRFSRKPKSGKTPIGSAPYECR